jgi:hypothetical protein
MSATPLPCCRCHHHCCFHCHCCYLYCSCEDFATCACHISCFLLLLVVLLHAYGAAARPAQE